MVGTASVFKVEEPNTIYLLFVSLQASHETDNWFQRRKQLRFTSQMRLVDISRLYPRGPEGSRLRHAVAITVKLRRSAHTLTNYRLYRQLG